jgi:hypothetical protein
MVINLSKGDQSRPSNQVQTVNSNYGGQKEENTMNQLPKDMEIEKPDSDATNGTMEEASIRLTFF